MNYALRRPTIRLELRIRLAQLVQEEARTGNLGSLRENPLLVFAQDGPSLEGFCIYCNTAVTTYSYYGSYRFKHNYHRGGIRQELCKQVGRTLGMVPVYPA